MDASCVLCERVLEMVAPMQPYGGGEMRLIFAYGSAKFDKAPGSTVFEGIICDECAEQCVGRMKCLLVGFDGVPYETEEALDEHLRENARRFQERRDAE